MTDKDYGRPGSASGRPLWYLPPVGNGTIGQPVSPGLISVPPEAAGERKSIARMIMQLEAAKQAAEQELDVLRRFQNRRIS